MKRVSLGVLCAFWAAPVLAQSEGYCMTPCGYGPSGEALSFQCADGKVGERLTEERIPSQVFADLGQFVQTFSVRNPEMGINVVEPGRSSIYYPCGLP